jgi:hypothetical protein
MQPLPPQLLPYGVRAQLLLLMMLEEQQGMLCEHLG